LDDCRPSAWKPPWPPSSLSSSRFRERPRHHAVSLPLSPPTAAASSIIRPAHEVLPQMVPGQPYNGAGIVLTGLTPAAPVLWRDAATEQADRIRNALAAIHGRHGQHAIGYGVTGLRARQDWEMRRDHLTPAYTTRWDQLLTATTS